MNEYIGWACHVVGVALAAAGISSDDAPAGVWVLGIGLGFLALGTWLLGWY